MITETGIAIPYLITKNLINICYVYVTMTKCVNQKCKRESQVEFSCHYGNGDVIIVGFLCIYCAEIFKQDECFTQHIKKIEG
jgi:hypothetical protein